MTSNPNIRSWPGWSHICLLSKQYIMFIVYTYTLFLGSEVYSAVWTWSLFCRAICPSFELAWSASVIKFLLPLSSLNTEKTEIFVWEFWTWFAMNIYSML
jgi:hypothetical protein